MTARAWPSHLPKGFSFSAAACGLKKSGLDLALLVSETAAAAAAVFTTNRVKAAPVKLCGEHLRKSRGQIRGVIVNSGNANCCTGPGGLAASRATASHLAQSIGCRPDQLFVCSTGVIGVPLRVERVLSALPDLVSSRGTGAAAFAQFTRAIMTTDTRPKWAAAKVRVSGRQIRLLGCAKGAGMIEPHMATMLAFIATDAAISPALLGRALRAVVGPTFHSITVDGDTSTNDTLAVLANGQSGAPTITGGAAYRKFGAALESVCRSLALAIVADGEGAQRVVEIEVRGAPSAAAADKIARTIANSPLVKTALAGADPNWGRILAAAGRAGVAFDFERANIRVAGILMCRSGREHPFNERVAHRRMLAKHVPIALDLHCGRGRARVWTCDFTNKYVDINASYRT
jgi:glutamate N-acetyltransferase / amino-acid N-acetyltransferase